MKLGGIRHDAPPRYDLVVDRISHEFHLSRDAEAQALEGTVILIIRSGGPPTTIFQFSLAQKLGVAVPKPCSYPRRLYTESSLKVSATWSFRSTGRASSTRRVAGDFETLDGGGWKKYQE